MISEREHAFYEYWLRNREKEKKSLRQLWIGIPIGLLFAIPILFGLFSGKYWYKRAEMVANAQTSPMVLVVAILIITAFMAVFYKKHQWDQKEQFFLELKARMEKERRETLDAAE